MGGWININFIVVVFFFRFLHLKALIFSGLIFLIFYIIRECKLFGLRIYITVYPTQMAYISPSKKITNKFYSKNSFRLKTNLLLYDLLSMSS